MTDPLISLPMQQSLIKDANALAKELDISSSRLIVLALKDFIRRHRKRKQLIDEINAAYSGGPDEEEIALQRKMRTTHRRIVEGEW